MNTNSLKYTCIFGGGAIRGVSYIGALKAMEELKISSATIAGSSVGAVIAGLIAVGYNAEELEDIFMEINFDLFRDIHFGFGKAFALSKGEVFTDWLRDFIEKKFYGEKYKKGKNAAVTFKDIDKDLIIITTDLTNFKCKEFSKYETPDFEIATAIRISSSMPGLMPPYKYNNYELVDGDLQKSWPLWRLSKNLCNAEERVLEFRLEGDYEGKGKNALDFMNTVYSCVTSIATEFIVETYGNRDKFDYVIINTGAVIIVDFNQPKEKREELIKIGYEQTMAHFRKILPEKKQKLIKDYKTIASSLNIIKRELKRNHVVKAKEELGNLFMILCELKDNIDKKYYKQMQLLKDKFVKELQKTMFFGGYQADKIKLLRKETEEIVSQIDLRISELEDYVVNAKHIDCLNK